MSNKTLLQNLSTNVPMNRRTFVGRLGAAGGLVLASTLPLAGAIERVVASPAPPPTDWHVDDMFVGFPRYAQPIGYPPPRTLALTASADPIDHQLLV